jgi:hypothetical protein
MGRASIEYNTFLAGLFTEANPITSPKNTSLDESNFELLQDGGRKRRRGLSLDPEYSPTSLTTAEQNILQSSSVRTLNWTTNDGFAFVIYFNLSGFLILDAATFAVKYSETIPINDLSASGDNLVATMTNKVPSLYKFEDGAITYQQDIYPMIRDLAGINDNIPTDSRLNVGAIFNSLKTLGEQEVGSPFLGYVLMNLLMPPSSPVFLAGLMAHSSDYAKHMYNLFNAGWGQRVKSYAHNNWAQAWDIFYRDSSNLLPARSDYFSLGMEGDPNQNGEKQLRVHSIISTALGTSKAAAGRFYFCPFIKNFYSKSNIGSHTQFNTQNFLDYFEDENKWRKHISSATFYGGRAWYASENSVFFTKTLDGNEDFEICYQVADPTSEVDSEIVPTDGGEVKILGASGIFSMQEYGDALMVFAKNGIWALMGTDSGLFSATGYSIKKIYDGDLLSSFRPLPTQGSLLNLSPRGLDVINIGEVSAEPEASSFPTQNVETIFRQLTTSELSSMNISYDTKASKIFIKINREGSKVRTLMIYDLKLKAWYKYEFPIPDNLIDYGLYQSKSFRVTNEPVSITYGGDVITYGTDYVVEYAASFINIVPTVLLLCIDTISNETKTFSFSDESFKDFVGYSFGTNVDGVDAGAYLTTGYQLIDSTNKSKSINNIMTHMVKTESAFVDDGVGGLTLPNQSSCIMRIGYDFPTKGSYTINDNNWSKPRQVYKIRLPGVPYEGFVPMEGVDVVSSKIRPRGKGRSMLFDFRTEPGKNCHLLGWAVDIYGEERV